MSKKFFGIVAMLISLIFLLTACGTENYTFTALKNNPAASDAVVSNGGIYVEKGQYSYYINGAQNNLSNNVFGEEHKGALVRTKTADLGKTDAVVEVVVPKVIYAADMDSSGFSIFGDKIYYTTTPVDKDTTGAVKTTHLDFMSVNLDGTGTKKVASVDRNTIVFSMVQTGEKVYVLFYNESEGTVSQIDYQTGDIKEVSEDVTSFAIDRSSNVIYYTVSQTKTPALSEEVVDNYNILYKFVAGSESGVEMKSGKKASDALNETYTISYANDGEVYFTTSVAGSGSAGTYKMAEDATAATLFCASVYETFIPYDGGAVVLGTGYLFNYKFDSNGIITSKTTIMPVAELSEMLKLVGTELYYSDSGILYKVDTALSNTEATRVVAGTMKDTWIQFDFVEKNGEMTIVYFNQDFVEGEDDYYLINYAWMDNMNANQDPADEDDDITSKRIGMFTEADQETHDELYPEKKV